MGHCNYCDVCGETYDYGERHDCPGPATEPVRVRPVDKHLEACRRVGAYVQPGYRLPTKRSPI